MKNSTEGFNNKLDQGKTESENSKTEQWNLSNLRSKKKQKMNKNKYSLRDLWHIIKCTNIYL